MHSRRLSTLSPIWHRFNETVTKWKKKEGEREEEWRARKENGDKEALWKHDELGRISGELMTKSRIKITIAPGREDDARGFKSLQPPVPPILLLPLGGRSLFHWNILKLQIYVAFCLSFSFSPPTLIFSLSVSRI